VDRITNQAGKRHEPLQWNVAFEIDEIDRLVS